MNTEIEKTLESLELIADDGNFAIFQAPAKKAIEWAVMEDNGVRSRFTGGIEVENGFFTRLMLTLRPCIKRVMTCMTKS